MGKRLIIKGADFSANAIEIDETGLKQAMAACRVAEGKGVVLNVAANSTVQIGYNKQYYGDISRSNLVVDVVNDKDVDYWYFSPSPAGITDVKSLFYGQTALLGIKHVDINGLADIGQMFYGCSGLKEIDLTDGCLESATTLYYICHSCSSLEKAAFRFNVISSYNAEAAFRDTPKLNDLQLDCIDTSGVTNLKDYLWQASGGNVLKTIDLSMFTGVTIWNNNTIYRCTGVETLILPDNVVVNIDCRTCTKLANLEGNFLLAKANNNSFSASPLTLESARKVINGLPQLDEGESYTLTLKASTKSLLTQDDKDAITAKGWVLA